MAAQHGQEPGAVLGHGGGFPYPDDPGADERRRPDDGDVVEQGPGAGDAASVG
jgi:hypothetical protein